MRAELRLMRPVRLCGDVRSDLRLVHGRELRMHLVPR
jgi:hypothetical protein